MYNTSKLDKRRFHSLDVNV